MPFRNKSEMFYANFDLTFVYTSHLDLNAPEMRIVGRLDGNGLLDSPGTLQLLTMSWNHKSGNYSPVWENHLRKIPVDKLDQIAAQIIDIWGQKALPQFEFTGSANTSFFGLTVTIHLYKMDGTQINAVLRAISIDDVYGNDSSKIMNFINYLSALSGYEDKFLPLSPFKTAEAIPVWDSVLTRTEKFIYSGEPENSLQPEKTRENNDGQSLRDDSTTAIDKTVEIHKNDKLQSDNDAD